MPMLRLKLIGQQFHDWLVIADAGQRESDHKTLWLCKCACPAGTEKIIAGGDLRSGKSKSCGHGRIVKGVRNVRARKPSLTGQTIGGYLIGQDTGRVDRFSAIYQIKCVTCGHEKELSRRSILQSTRPGRKGIPCPVCADRKKDDKFQAAAVTNSQQELTPEQVSIVTGAMRAAIFKSLPDTAKLHLEEIVQDTWLELLQKPGLVQMADNILGPTAYVFAKNIARRLLRIDPEVRFIEPNKLEDGTWESDIFERVIVPTPTSPTQASQPSSELQSLALEMSGLTDDEKSFMANCLERGFKDREEKQRYDAMAARVRAAFAEIVNEVEGTLDGEDGQVAA